MYIFIYNVKLKTSNFFSLKLNVIFLSKYQLIFIYMFIVPFRKVKINIMLINNNIQGRSKVYYTLLSFWRLSTKMYPNYIYDTHIYPIVSTFYNTMYLL
jgi:hypothetical protein